MFPTISIKTTNDFFDFKAKYATDGSGAVEEVVYLNEELQNKINAASLKCWNEFNCSVYVRVDFIVSDDGVPYVLELNTLPGMTTTSLIPRSAKAKGVSYSELINKIIEYSINTKR